MTTKLERLIIKLMKQYKNKEITSKEFNEILTKKGYAVQTLNENEKYVVDGKILIAFLNIMADLSDKNETN